MCEVHFIPNESSHFDFLYLPYNLPYTTDYTFVQIYWNKYWFISTIMNNLPLDICKIMFVVLEKGEIVFDAQK